MFRELGNDVELLSRYYYPTAETYGALHRVLKREGDCLYSRVHRVFTGRERDWWKRKVNHIMNTLTKKIYSF